MTLAKEGMDGKACAALASKDLAQENASNASKMYDLHPPAAPLPRNTTDDVLIPQEIIADIVLKALESLSCGTAPGPTGL